MPLHAALHLSQLTPAPAGSKTPIAKIDRAIGLRGQGTPASTLASPLGCCDVSKIMDEPSRIGRWSFDAREPVLRDGSKKRRLEDRAARTLELLCRRRGEVVTKAELIDAVWGGRSVSANSVAIVIGDLRRALEDDPRAPAYIVTVNKRGYRLTPQSEPVPQPITPRQWHRQALVAAGALAVLGAVGIGAASLNRAAAPIELVTETTRNETGNPALDPLTRSLNAVVVDSATHLHGVRVSETAAKTEARGKLALRSRLILWNGAPELALSAVDLKSGATIWSGFAHGPSGTLAKGTAAKIASLQGTIDNAF